MAWARAALLTCLAGAISAEDVSVLSVSGTDICAACNQWWEQIPSGQENALTLEIVHAQPLTGGCENASLPADVTNGAAFAGKAVAFQRGSCTFSAMVEVTNDNGGLGVIVFGTEGNPKFGPGASNVSDYDNFRHPVCMVDYNDRMAVLNGAPARLYTAIYAPFDVSIIGFVLLALGAILVGSFLGTETERRVAFGNNEVTAASMAQIQSSPEQAPEEFTTRKIFMFVVFASAFLVLMYFLFDYLVYILIGVFALFGFLSLYELSADAASRTSLWNYQVNIPRYPKTPIVCIAIIAFSASIAVMWGIERHAWFAWILQDIMGVAILITIVKLVAIPNIKLATLLLGLLLLYDVFFVFITPLLTHKGDSIMVHAATGNATRTDASGCTQPKEMMPFLLRIPRIATPVCRCSRDSMLGFGDVVFPGWLVAMGVRVDCYRGLRALPGPRYIFSVVMAFSYIFGLLCAFVAAGLMSTAQPALLYLTPSTLIGAWGLGRYYGLLHVMKNLSNELKDALCRQRSTNRSPDDGLVSREPSRRRRVASDNDEDSATLLDNEYE